MALDNEKAVYWLSKSADQGHENAQEVLAHFHAKGEAVPDKYVNPKYSSAEIVSEIGEMFLGLVASISNRTVSGSAVDAYAKCFEWSEIPENMRELVVVKNAYHKLVKGHEVLLGDDGTVDMFSIAMGYGFDPIAIKEYVSEVLTINSLDSSRSMGYQTDIYQIIDKSDRLGLMIIAYGVIGRYSGVGRVSFMSLDRAIKEGMIE